MLVRCAFLRNHTAHFCTVMLGIFAYCDSAILRSIRNLEQNAIGLGKAAADTFCELCIFQFGKSTCYAGNAASQIFCKTGKWIEYINAPLCIYPVVLFEKTLPDPAAECRAASLCGLGLCPAKSGHRADIAAVAYWVSSNPKWNSPPFLHPN